VIAHWGVEDPATFTGSPQATERVFHNVAQILYRRVQLFTSLPVEKLSRLKVEKLTQDIGKDRAVGLTAQRPRSSIRLDSSCGRCVARP